MKESMGQIIRKLRKERNLTQEELAEQLNITYQAVSRWENETGMPDISQVIPLANVFGVSVFLCSFCYVHASDFSVCYNVYIFKGRCESTSFRRTF